MIAPVTPEHAWAFLVIIVALALIFDYINGFHDAANAIATVVATRVLSPKVAVMYGASLNFLGALMGTEVAATVGKGLVDSQYVTMETILCALLAAIIWNLITWVKGLPSSSSHALMGSLVGAVFFSKGLPAALNGANHGLVHWQSFLNKVVWPMFSSPVLGVSLGFVLMAGLTWLVYKWPVNRINGIFGRMQIVSAGLMALSHGQNDAQKSMGIIALALLIYQSQTGQGSVESQHFVVPLWVMMSCAVAIGLGTLSGGWKIIRTLGSKMIKLQPIHGFAAETTSFAIISAASHWGIPVSTTHVITSSIMGVGSTKRLSAVKWGVVGNILWAWVLTLPITFILAGTLRLAYGAIGHWF